MRHNTKKAKLGKTAAHRKAMFRNMLSSLFEHGSVTTTEAKAKELKRRADILIGYAREGGLHRRRLAAGQVFGAFALQRLFDHWGKAFPTRETGFVRTVKIGQRQGDGAPLTMVEIIDDAAGDKAAATAEK